MAPKKVKAAKNKQTTQIKQKKAAIIATAEDSDSSEEESSEDEEPVPKKAVTAKKVANGKGKADSGSSEESSDDEEETMEVGKGSDDDDDDDDSSDEEAQQKPAKRKAEAPKQKPSKKAKVDKESDSDDDDDEDDSDDEESEEEAEVKQKKEKAKEPEDKGKEGLIIKKGPTFKMDSWNVGKLFLKAGLDVEDVTFGAGLAFVEFGNSSDLEKALTHFQSSHEGISCHQGFSSELKVAAPAANKSFDGPKGDDHVMFVKNLPETCEEDMLQETFPDATVISIPRKEGGYHKGFAFIEFSDKSGVDSALEEKQGVELDGYNLFLDRKGGKKPARGGGGYGGGGGGGGGFGGDRRQSGGVAGQTKTLFVKNLSYNTDGDSLKSAFDNSLSARIKTSEDGSSRGFGYVDFSTADEAKEAFENMNGQDIDGRSVVVDFANEIGGGGGRGGGGRGGGGFRGGRGRGGDRGRGGRGGRGDGRGFRGGGGRGFRGGGGGFAGKKRTFDD